MKGWTQNNRGRYKCDFCDHSTYKTQAGIVTHVRQRHAIELMEKLALENVRLKNQPPKVEIKERIVYRDPPKKKEPEYWYIKNGGGIYCETCKQVQMGVGIPAGQTIENTPHHCGNRTLKLVLEVR